jgi:hypothetical protein
VKWWPLPELPTPGTPRVLTTGDEGTAKQDLSLLAQQFPLQRQLAGEPPQKKNKAGAKKRLSLSHLEALRTETFRILDLHGDPDSPDPDPTLNSREKIILRLQEYAQKEEIFKNFKDGAPSRPTLQPLVNDWIEEWREGP